MSSTIAGKLSGLASTASAVRQALAKPPRTRPAVTPPLPAGTITSLGTEGFLAALHPKLTKYAPKIGEPDRLLAVDRRALKEIGMPVPFRRWFLKKRHDILNGDVNHIGQIRMHKNRAAKKT